LSVGAREDEEVALVAARRIRAIPESPFAPSRPAVSMRVGLYWHFRIRDFGFRFQGSGSRGSGPGFRV